MKCKLHPKSKIYKFKGRGRGNEGRCCACANESAKLSYMRKKTFLGEATEDILDSLGKKEYPNKYGFYKTQPIKEYHLALGGRR